MTREVTVTEEQLGMFTVDYGDGREQSYPSMAEAMQAAHAAAQYDQAIVRVTTGPTGTQGV